MEETLFDDLLQSLKETKAITEGTAKASREFKVGKTPIRPDTNAKGRSQFVFSANNLTPTHDAHEVAINAAISF